MDDLSESLFPEVNREATINNCKHFFNVTFPRMVRISGVSVAILKSPSSDGMPKTQNTENSMERRIVQRLTAEQIVKRTIEAISHCDQRSKEVLDLLYLEDYSDTMCFMHIGYSRSHYFDVVKPEALLQFADCYMMDDLHIYK
ncbi:ArpU family phage packaging/lysis transcriptional regulator [Lentilactobacillus senioris]|uniref:ArpU family phage packaging/lysis transcriptional regulator n=1 Tax=Lentilactobacillus senioris TaxID=931534 RepID=UPI003D297442